jgi:phage tail sheath protein FI
LNILKNQDEFDINLILLPGIIDSLHTSITSKAIDVCEDRGDCFTILDPVEYGKNVANATTQAEAKDSNFAAMYYPWIKISDSQVAGAQRWVPPSVVLGGIYAFNDRVAHPWFAPAGLNRGGITTAIQAQRKLTQSDRDTLYDSNVNPIATFPGQGVTVFGQKTLQKKNSALDRINVRRLLIRVKKFVASSSRFLVFEQNTAATRRRFLGIVNPFLEQVQSQSGLNAFRVVMDETNNTPDTIDRNQLVGQLFLQPTRTAEFIVLDFTVQPTGASFPE